MKIKVFDSARAAFDEWFQKQYQKGLLKYGTVLTTFNGRDAFEDSMQEAVDLIMYVNQLRIERNRLCEVLFYGIEPTEEEKEYIERHGKVK